MPTKHSQLLRLHPVHALLVAAGLLIACQGNSSIAQPDPTLGPAKYTVTLQAPSAVTIPKDFVGISLEWGSIRDAFGVPGTPNAVFTQLLKNLGQGVIRIGGGSSDVFCWDKATATNFTCRAGISASMMESLFSASAQTGWPTILGVNLARNEPQSAVAFVKEAVLPNKQRVLGIEIGNEPDLFPNHSFPVTNPDGTKTDKLFRTKPYGYAEHLPEFKAYASALAADPQTMSLPVVGPATCCAWRKQLGQFAQEAATGDQLQLLTTHHYPQNVCDKTKAANVTVTTLLDQARMQYLIDQYGPSAQEVNATGKRLRMDEMNSVACGGKAGVSDGFASALWGLDEMFTLASLGFSGVNLHNAGSAYPPVNLLASQDATTKVWTFKNEVRPLYYAMYLFSQVQGQQLVPFTLEATPTNTAPANIKAWATSRSDGQITVVLLNKDASFTGNIAIKSISASARASMLVLRAPALDDTQSTTLGTQRFDEKTGLLPVPTTDALAPQADGSYLIALPASSAVMVTITK
jgi:hypothetical protein